MRPVVYGVPKKYPGRKETHFFPQEPIFTGLSVIKNKGF